MPDLLSYLFPQTIMHTSSPYNRDIRVVVENGQKKLLANGIQQSGPGVNAFWKFAFSHLPLSSAKDVKTVLILGIGGGTVFHILHDLYQDAGITGVDIDEKIVAIAQTHFGLGDMTRLELIVSDARDYMRKVGSPYDLIVVDLYIGREIPGFESTAAFVSDLRRRTKTGGSVVINFLHDGVFAKRAEHLYGVLQKEFQRVQYADLPYNRFFLAR